MLLFTRTLLPLLAPWPPLREVHTSDSRLLKQYTLFLERVSAALGLEWSGPKGNKLLRFLVAGAFNKAAPLASFVPWPT